jgi:hypothetical protein
MASRGAKGDPELATRVLGAIDARIAEIDKELAAKFPDYAVFANPSPLTIKETQAQLGADEALVLFLDTQKTRHTREETFIWAVTKTDMRWVRADLGTNELTREVKALRCGLDNAAWEDPFCAVLAGQNYTSADRNAHKPLPFDHARAQRLYQTLFAGVEDLIKGKQLLIVPSGPLPNCRFRCSSRHRPRAAITHPRPG